MSHSHGKYTTPPGGSTGQKKINQAGQQHLIDAELRLPLCIAAIGTPPPEDVGGVSGFAELRRILSDPQDEEYEDMKDWADSMEWKPFDMEQINEALKRWRW